MAGVEHYQQRIDWILDKGLDTDIREPQANDLAVWREVVGRAGLL